MGKSNGGLKLEDNVRRAAQAEDPREETWVEAQEAPGDTPLPGSIKRPTAYSMKSPTNSHIKDHASGLTKIRSNHGIGDSIEDLRNTMFTADEHLDEAHEYSDTGNLAARIAELERLLAEETRRAEYEARQYREGIGLLEEKTDLIRELHLKVQELQARPAVETRQAVVLPKEEELLALSEELEAAREQLKEDEESLMQQMREMEVQMSRERAELARQRNELQKLHNEIRHEIETASREAVLRDRLQPLQRKHQELGRPLGFESPRPANDAPSAPAAPPPATPAKDTRSGLFRRIFGTNP